MKNTTISVIFLLISAVAWMLLTRRPARPTPPVSPPSTPTEFKPVNDWQRSIRLDARTNYRLDDATREEIRREGEKQRPQEGRN